MAGIIGTVLSGIGTLFQLLGMRRDAPDVRVDVVYALYVRPVTPDQPGLLISARNHGRRPVDIDSVGLILESRSTVAIADARLPYRLEEGSRYTVSIPPAIVARANVDALGPIRWAFVSDATEKMHRVDARPAVQQMLRAVGGAAFGP